MPGLLQLPDELLLKAGSYLSPHDLIQLGLVNHRLTGIAQDHLFRSVTIPDLSTQDRNRPASSTSARSYADVARGNGRNIRNGKSKIIGSDRSSTDTSHILFMVATLLRKLALAAHIKSLKLTITDKKLSDNTKHELRSLEWTVPMLKTTCETRRADCLPVDLRPPYAVQGDETTNMWYRNWPGFWNPIRALYSSDKETFYGGVLLSLLPNLENLEIKVVKYGKLDSDIVGALFGWNLEGLWLQRMLAQKSADDAHIHTILDSVPCFNNIRKLVLTKENYLLLHYGSFPNLRTVEVHLPLLNATSLAPKTMPLPAPRHPEEAEKANIPLPVDIPYQVPDCPTRKLPGVESVRITHAYLVENDDLLEPVIDVFQLFPSCTRLRLDLDINEADHRILLGPGDYVRDHGLSYEQVIREMHVLCSTISILVFNHFEPNPSAHTILGVKLPLDRTVRSGIDWHRRFIRGLRGCRDSLLAFPQLRHLVLPFYIIATKLTEPHNLNEYILFPKSLETLEVICPFVWFDKLLYQIAENKDALPNLKTIIVYMGNRRHFNSAMFYPLAVDFRVWTELQKVGVEYLLRPYTALDLEAERPVHIERMREMGARIVS